MKFKKIEEVMKKQFVGKKVSLRGWVSNKRFNALLRGILKRGVMLKKSLRRVQLRLKAK